MGIVSSLQAYGTHTFTQLGASQFQKVISKIVLALTENAPISCGRTLYDDLPVTNRLLRHHNHHHHTLIIFVDATKLMTMDCVIACIKRLHVMIVLMILEIVVVVLIINKQIMNYLLVKKKL